jgi:ankyrin repeat protein
MNRHALVAALLLASSPALAAKALTLHEAAFAGDLKAVERALERTPVDAWDHEGKTALMAAAEAGRLEAAKLLLDKGASLSAADAALRTPLHHAAAGPSFPLLELLLDRGADPAVSAYGQTPLRAALGARREQNARRLLELPASVAASEDDDYGRSLLFAAVGLPELFSELASKPGADLDRRNASGGTLLMEAAAGGSTDTVRWLLSKGADKLAKDDYGQQAAHYAANSASFETFKLLAEGSDVAGPCPMGYCQPGLYRAGGSLETARWLLAQGADAAGPESSFYPPLHGAAQRQASGVVKALLDAGAPVDQLDRYDQTALMKAARYGTPENVKALLDGGASVAAEDSEGRHALSHAAESGSLEKIKLLLAAGSDRGLASYGERTPASYAAGSGSLPALEALLDRKTVDQADTYGRTALHYAAASGKAEVVDYLLAKGASLDAGRGDVLKDALEKGAWEPVQSLLAAARKSDKRAAPELFDSVRSCSVELAKLALSAPGADPGAREGGSATGATLLMNAAARPRCFDTVKLLLARGADLHAPDGDGRGPLMNAAAGGSPLTLKLLLSRGADANLPLRAGYYKGQTPLHAAAGSYERARVLVDKGARQQPDENGVTPAMTAAAANDRAYRLLGAKADVAQADKAGKTLLMYAASGHADTVGSVLARGADARAAAKNGTTALHAAAGSWTAVLRKVELLLAKGAEVDAVDNDGFTPLYRAFERRDFRVPRLLAAKGASATRLSKNGHNMLHAAAYADEADSIKTAFELAPDLDPNQRDKGGYAPLSRAGSSNVPAVRLLLERGAMLNAPDGKASYLKDIAAYRPFSLVKFVIDRGADVNALCPLCNAAAGGRRAVIKALLDRGAAVNGKGDYGQTPLSRAAENGRAAAVRLLIERGATVAGSLALSEAAEDGHAGAMKVLLEKGADTEETDKDGRTPLRRAARYGRAAAVRLLLEDGAKVEAAPDKTPLFDAARSGSLATLKLLERKGGGLKVATPTGYTLLHTAAESGNLDMLRYLLDAGLAPDAYDSEKGTPLWAAVDNSKFGAAELLLSKGAAVEGTVKGEPFLHKAVGWSCGTRAKWLLDRGAKPDVLDFEGRTALHKASDSDCVSLLLQRGANVNVQAKDGSTALTKAAESYGAAERVKLLLEKNAYHFYRRADGRSALSLAASHSSYGTGALEHLLAAGAAVDEADQRGQTPLMYAVESGSTRTVRLLLEKGADPNRLDSNGGSAFGRAVGGYRASPEIARMLAKAGAKVDMKDSNQRTPLSHACESYSMSTETIKMLLELGADPNNVDKWNTMPLASAIYKDSILAAELLADKGADVDASTYYGTPVLVWAAQNGKLAAVKFLTGRGAKLETPGSSGRTALMEAAYNGHLDVVRHLVEKGASLTAGDSSGHNALKWAEIGNKSAVQTYLAARTPSAAPAAAPAGAPSAPAQAAAPAQPGVSSSDLQNLVKAAVQGAMEANKPAPAAPKKTYSSDVDKPSYKAAERPQDAALVIGIERYAGELPPADHAERDAAAVRAHFAALGVPARNLIHLTGERAGRASIEKYVEQWLPNVAKPGSRVYVYFSGHGAPDVKKGDAYLVPWDGDPNYLETTAYPVSRLYAKLEKLPAAEVLVAMDACFSGAKGRSVLPKGARPLVTKVNQAAPTGKVVSLSASDSNEITGTYDEQGHGLFTYYFLKGLNGAAGGAGNVTSGSLYRYLKPKVQDEAQRSNRQQTPQYAGRGEVPLR